MSSLKSVAVLALLVVASVLAQDVEFNNEWDQPLNFECPEGKVIKSVYSIHDNGREDRRFKLVCGKAPSDAEPKQCEWTSDYVNEWDQPVMFLCPANYLVAGIYSVHDNSREDRRMKFKCCRQPGIKTKSCQMSDFLNSWDQPLDYTVGSGRALVGWMSRHDNSKEDRIHKMVDCLYRA
ncbi:hemagglutinin/amebocyte aggregation factor [Elysia marginata]|uniref:Hemagglutinin/amebocyte aggregation factor n=1 Tax=Elysia marginata TaxID=1093978 RepID=A0AAV4H9A1_9GAST|nr:hemagglutinin/amebocyte aggregation factor [Elysia marginata]